jgi:hypothetical protein
MKLCKLYKKDGYESEWKDILYVEEKVLSMIIDIYYVKDIIHFELEGCYGIKINFKYKSVTYEIMISNRSSITDNNIGFSICNIDNYDNIDRQYTNLTIKNDNKCIYTIYKIILTVLG